MAGTKTTESEARDATGDEKPYEDEPETIEGEAVEELPPEASSQELVIRHEREGAAPPAGVLPTPKEWEATLAVARQIAATPFVPDDYRGNPESVVAAILTGREMGIGPMQSLRQIHMIDGRPAFAADLMLAKMREGGVMIIASEATAERAFIKAKRRDTGEEATVEWTVADAEKAGLTNKRNWRTYPADMLWARCVGRLARRLGSDLLGGLVYSSEEMQDWEGEVGDYGVGTGYAASTEREFDPGVDVLINAHKGEGHRERIVAGLKYKAPDVDWRKVIEQAWEGEHTVEFWKRFSNLEAKLAADHPHEMPPVSDEEIIDAVAWAFSGVVVEVSKLPKEPDEGEKQEGAQEASSAPRTRRRTKAKDEPSGDAALSPEAQEQMKTTADDDDIGFGD
jgi:hypothetical protein